MSYWKYDMLILLTNDGKLHVYDPQQSDYQHDSSESTKRWSAFGMTAEEYDHEVPNYEVNYKSEWVCLNNMFPVILKIYTKLHIQSLSKSDVNDISLVCRAL